MTVRGLLDPILGITEAFLKDPSQTKINLGVVGSRVSAHRHGLMRPSRLTRLGAYRDDDGKPVVLQCVREAERRVLGNHFMEYLPIAGMRDFVVESMKLAFGEDASVIKDKRVAAIQMLSGTGSCRIMADFQHRFMPRSKIYIPVPTWSNHNNIWADAQVPAAKYRYYKPATRGLDLEGMMEDIQAAPSGSVFLLHACAHNPTGVDPTPGQCRQQVQAAAAAAVAAASAAAAVDSSSSRQRQGRGSQAALASMMGGEGSPASCGGQVLASMAGGGQEQWKQLSALMLEKGHFPFFDMAYQGFATGDCERDAQAIRIFLADGHRLGCSQSYAKNMGLYGQRVGCLSLVTDEASQVAAVESQMKQIARPMYSNPPQHGALLVTKVLQDPGLKQQWYQEVRGMAERIISMRSLLRQGLEELNTPGTWDHVTSQIGMFAYSGMTETMVDALASKHSIYMTRNGRISMAGVNTHNVHRLATAMHDVITTVK
ncbi:hypothetical protein QJQ45_004834 [Haematococcus lacustris]|nr:hypothetical protein QJQ45_004834 [Haematococcus lacustris]